MKSWKWKKWQVVLLSFGLIIVGLLVFWPKPPEPPQIIASVGEFETYLQRLVDFGIPPGLSFVVVKDGKLFYEKGFGWADRPRKIAATSESIYHWWSITKIATAIAILQLQEEGKLRLDDPVKSYLSFFNVQYPSANSAVITIRHLLTHSSGLPDAGFRIMSWIHHDGEPSVNQTALVEKVLPDFSKLEFEPGDHAEYTNVGYMVLGAIIEKVSGQTYETYIRKHLLEPLGMTHTDFQYTHAMEPFEAAGSHPLFDKWTPLVPFIAASYVREISGNHLWFKRVYNDQTPPTGLIGSATDAAHLAAAYMNGGELDGRRILSQESIARMTNEGHIKGKTNDPRSKRMQGIGWQVYDDDGRVMIKHEGGGLGFSTVMQLHPDKKLGFVLFTNDVTCQTWRIMNLAASLSW
jgi:CubicO group peptidase (beta-lactamase class C family)